MSANPLTLLAQDDTAPQPTDGAVPPAAATGDTTENDPNCPARDEQGNCIQTPPGEQPAPSEQRQTDPGNGVIMGE